MHADPLHREAKQLYDIITRLEALRVPKRLREAAPYFSARFVSNGKRSADRRKLLPALVVVDIYVGGKIPHLAHCWV